ncbi:MAG TPA: YtxH domain-containing protein, partial [Abditibacteriaceae bacterium]
MSDEPGAGYFRGMITGLLFGAAAALLLAPKKGGELRGDLAEGAVKLKDKAGTLGGTVAETVSHTAHELKERGGELLGSVKASVTGDDALAQSIDGAAEIADEIADEDSADADGGESDSGDDENDGKNKEHDVV